MTNPGTIAGGTLRAGDHFKKWNKPTAEGTRVVKKRDWKFGQWTN